MGAGSQASTHNNRLLEQARGGDHSAFWQLVDGYRPYLKSVARNVLGTRLPSDGSDIVADGLCLALDRLDQFEGSRAPVFLGWLAAIVRNKALKSVVRAGHFGPLPANSDNEVQLPTDSSSPDDRAGRREQSAILLQAIERLPESRRTVIRLRNFEGLAFPEIAERMGRTCDAVRQLWVQAVKELRKTLGNLS